MSSGVRAVKRGCVWTDGSKATEQRMGDQLQMRGTDPGVSPQTKHGLSEVELTWSQSESSLLHRGPPRPTWGSSVLRVEVKTSQSDKKHHSHLRNYS